MMLFYNNEAGKLLKASKMGILRKQSNKILASAEYCLAEEESLHYSLQSYHYAHVSSPIRRYADLLNQRVLKLILKQSDESYIIPIAIYDMNRRAKKAKNYERDLCFLEAIKTSRTFKATLVEIGEIKMKLYIPEWRKCVSVPYKKIDDKIWSMDEQRELNLEEIEINCTFNLNARNWKEKVTINIV
jgi:exoribonuclease II